MPLANIISSLLRACFCSALFMSCTLFAAGIASGQDQPKPSNAAKPSAAESASDEAAKQKIMNSPEWKQAKYAFDEWISVQQIYDKKRVAEIKQQLDAQIKSMNASQLQEFLEDMEHKLKILNSPEAQDARAWLARNMALAAAPYREKLRKQFPDVANMTAAQLDLAMREFEEKRAASAQQSTEAATARKEQVQATEQYLKASEQSREQALNRATYDAANYSRSYYVPAPQVNLNVPVARSYPYNGPLGGYYGYRW